MGKNPFRQTKTEEFNHHFENLVQLFIRAPLGLELFLGKSSIIAEGSKGSGRTMLLKYFSLEGIIAHKELEAQNLVKPLPEYDPYIGVYIKCEPTYYGEGEFETTTNFSNYFPRFFNLHCAGEIIRTINYGLIDKAIFEYTKKDVDDLILQLKKIFNFKNNIKNLKELYREIENLRTDTRSNFDSQTYKIDSLCDYNFLDKIDDLIKDYIPSLRDMRFHLLLDEYDNLSNLQQRIVNTYVKKRQPFTYKIATTKLNISKKDIYGRSLTSPADYETVQLDDDQVLGISDKFIKFLEEIANKRLEISKSANKDIKSLLKTKEYIERPKTEKKYSGFEQLVMISSGIVRQFLLLCRNMYTFAQQESPNSEVFSISPEIQDKVFKDESEHLYKEISTQETSNFIVETLINSLGKLFLAIQKSGGVESKVIRVEIHNFDSLKDNIKDIFYKAVEKNALIIPNRSRIAKNKLGPTKGFILNRLLCPHYRIDPSSRWDVELNKEDINDLLYNVDHLIQKKVRPKDRKKITKPQRLSIMPVLPFFDKKTCPLSNTPCLDYVENLTSGFLAIPLPDSGHIVDAKNILCSEFSRINYKKGIKWSLKAADTYPSQGDIACKVCYRINQAGFGVYEITDLNANVLFELGIAIARNKRCFLIWDKQEKEAPPSPFDGVECHSYFISKDSVKKLIKEKIIPAILDPNDNMGRLSIAPKNINPPRQLTALVILPHIPYYKDTVFPSIKSVLENAGYFVNSTYDGITIDDIYKTCKLITESSICLIDTTHKNSTRSMYLGMALGFKIPFFNLVDESSDPNGAVFTDAKNKSIIKYKDISTLKTELKKIFKKSKQ